MTPFDLDAAGVPQEDRERAQESGALVQVFPGVFRLGEFAELIETRWLAACLWSSEAVLSHRTAAAIHGFDGIPKTDAIEITVRRTGGRRPDGIRLHTTRDLPDEDVRVARGFRVTSKARTLFDLATEVSENELAYAVEAATRFGEVPVDWIARRLHQLRKRGREGVTKLERVLLDREARGIPMASALEVRFWRLVRDAGLPLPNCQRPFDDDDGQPGSIDFAWPDAMLAIETRGAKVHSTPDAFEKNSRRTARLTVLGWSVMPVTWNMLEENAPRVIRQVTDALRIRGAIPPVQQPLF